MSPYSIARGHIQSDTTIRNNMEEPYWKDRLGTVSNKLLGGGGGGGGLRGGGEELKLVIIALFFCSRSKYLVRMKVSLHKNKSTVEKK